VASLSQGRTAAAQCGLFTHKSVPVIFEPPCIYQMIYWHNRFSWWWALGFSKHVEKWNERIKKVRQVGY